MFVGRENELKLLNDAYRSGKDELVVLYGRRRIGKSSLKYYWGQPLERQACYAERGRAYFLQSVQRAPDLPQDNQYFEKALISLYGPDNSLKNTGYFHHFVTLDDIL